MEHIIGVDFDNTLVNYDDLMYAAARQQGLIQTNVRKNKKTIRNLIHQLPDGDVEWQRLQAIMYGPRINEATLAVGVKTFFRLCKKHKATVYIISHKTEYASYDETRTNLRAAAVNWMNTHIFLKADGLGLSPQNVYFEATRQEKIERIRQLRCTHFIDDLEETYLENSFPANVEKILYTPNIQYSPLSGVRVFNTWKDIGNFVFGKKR